MANKRKEALIHFPLDLDFFDDEKLFLAEELVDPSGYDTALRALMSKLLIQLYCFVYKNGYHIKWDTAMQIAVTRTMSNGMTSTNVNKMVEALVKAGLFDEQSFSQKILTSKRIQETWLTVVFKARRVHQTISKEVLLLSKDEMYNIKHPKSKSETEKDKNVAGSKPSVTGSKPNSPRRSGENASSPTGNPKNDAETGNSVARNLKNATGTTPEGVKSNAKTPIKVGNVAGTGEPESEKGKNDAGTEEPFALNNNNKSLIGDKGYNDNNGENSGNVADLSENVAENENYETDDRPDVTFYVIPTSDTGQHAIEVCFENYKTSIYRATFERHCMKFGFSEELMLKWAVAFNLKLIDEGKLVMPMGGNGWCRYLANWIATVDDYTTVDPMTLQHVKKNKYANSRTANQAGTTGPAGNGQKVGGVQVDSIAKLLASKKR